MPYPCLTVDRTPVFPDSGRFGGLGRGGDLAMGGCEGSLSLGINGSLGLLPGYKSNEAGDDVGGHLRHREQTASLLPEGSFSLLPGSWCQVTANSLFWSSLQLHCQPPAAPAIHRARLCACTWAHDPETEVLVMEAMGWQGPVCLPTSLSGIFPRSGLQRALDTSAQSKLKKQSASSCPGHFLPSLRETATLSLFRHNYPLGVKLLV